MPGETIDVAQGTYSPGSSATSTFQMISGVSIVGGYAGYGTSNPNAQNATAYPTILSGDNVSQAVVTSSQANSTAVLNGFTITGGTGSGYPSGGAIYVSSGSPTFIDCTVTQNGRGMYNVDSSPILIDCSFTDNTAEGGAAAVF